MDHAALDTSPHAVLVLDPRGGMTYANASADSLLRLVAPSTTTGPDLLALVHERHHDRAWRVWDKTPARAPVGPVRRELSGPDRRWVPVHPTRARQRAEVDAHGQGWLHGRPTWRADLPARLALLALLALLAGQELRR